MIAGLLPPWVRWAALAGLAVASAGLGYTRGASSVQDRWDKATAEQSSAIAIARQHQASVTERVVTRYVDRVRTVREAGETIVHEVPVYVPTQCDSDGRLPAGWRLLHDAAASGEPAEPSRAADAQPVAPDAAAETVARNYLSCRLTAEQLIALQAWVREQSSAAVP